MLLFVWFHPRISFLLYMDVDVNFLILVQNLDHRLVPQPVIIGLGTR